MHYLLSFVKTDKIGIKKGFFQENFFCHMLKPINQVLVFSVFVLGTIYHETLVKKLSYYSFPNVCKFNTEQLEFVFDVIFKRQHTFIVFVRALCLLTLHSLL